MFCSVFQVLFRWNATVLVALSFFLSLRTGLRECYYRRIRCVGTNGTLSVHILLIPVQLLLLNHYYKYRRGLTAEAPFRVKGCAHSWSGCKRAAMVNQLGQGVTTQRTRHATSRHGHNKKRLRRRQNQKRLPKSRTGRLSGCPSVSRYHTCAQP